MLTDTEYEMLRHREEAEFEALQGLEKQTEQQRLKWVATNNLILIEKRERELKRQIVREEEEKSAHDLKEEREARMADYERDRAV